MWADLVCLEMPKTCCGEGSRRIFPCCCFHPELFFPLFPSVQVCTQGERPWVTSCIVAGELEVCLSLFSQKC